MKFNINRIKLQKKFYSNVKITLCTCNITGNDRQMVVDFSLSENIDDVYCHCRGEYTIK